MSKSPRRERGTGPSRGLAARQRLQFPMFRLMLVLAAMVAGVFFLLHARQTGAQSTAPPTAPPSVAHQEAKKGFDCLKGRWLRPDGGYVIDIREIDAGGKMAAAYFNPRPINVSRAEAALEGTTIKVFIELRDKNYPGSTYTLTYDPGSDQLRGVYFQAALQQSFDVFFVRMK